MAPQVSPSRVGVKEAVQAAIVYLKDLPISEDLSDLRLEEVEQSDDEKYWLITLGFYVPATAGNGPIGEFLPRHIRKYKLFKVDAKTGKVRSMKIRTVE